MDTTSSDLRVPSEEDAAAARNTTITWLRGLGRSPEHQEKTFHVERLCRSAVAGGFIREATGSQPDVMLIRFDLNLSYSDNTELTLSQGLPRILAPTTTKPINTSVTSVTLRYQWEEGGYIYISARTITALGQNITLRMLRSGGS